MLAAAGQRCFSSATLAAFRAAQPNAGAGVWTSNEAKSAASEGEDDNESDTDDLEELLNDFFCRAAVASRSQTRETKNFDEASFRRQVNRGLAYIDEAAQEVHRRNENLSRCLEEVQHDISRISERMQAGRKQLPKATVMPGGLIKMR
eukprot:Skav200390  [mRNA]  locus=scaffold2518:500697:504132:- [translate_table: standard]